MLIGAGTLSGYETGPGAVNPYDQFGKLRPTPVIEHGIFIYDGHFEIPLASAMAHAYQSSELLRTAQPEGALEEARFAVSADPDSVRAHVALGNALLALKRSEEARRTYQAALECAKAVEPECQAGWIPMLRKRLSRQ